MCLILKVGVSIRPYAKEMLKELSEIFEIIVFTASNFTYANAVLDVLDRLYRKHCILSQDKLYIKDLRILKDRELKNIALVDNTVISYSGQLANGVPIIPYFNNKKDDQLKKLTIYLKRFVSEDIRSLNRRTFKLHLYKGTNDRTVYNHLF